MESEVTLAELIVKWEEVPADPVRIMQFVSEIPEELMPAFILWAHERTEQLRGIVRGSPDLVN